MKIKREIVKKMIANCTGDEIDFMICIAQYQDETGRVSGIDYKDIIKEIGICKSNFYKVLHSLEKKEIIKVDYMNLDYGMWEVVIIGNAFLDKQYTSYLNANLEILHLEGFRKLTKSEKVILLEIILMNNTRLQFRKLSIQKVMEITGKTRRSVMKFLKQLKQAFGDILKVLVDGNSVRIQVDNGLDRRRSISERNVYLEHFIKHTIKKSKYSEADNADIQNLIILFKQYAVKGFETVCKAFYQSLREYAGIHPAYINKLCGEA